MKAEIKLVFDESDDPRDIEKYQSALAAYDCLSEIVKTLLIDSDVSGATAEHIGRTLKKHNISPELIDCFTPKGVLNGK